MTSRTAPSATTHAIEHASIIERGGQRPAAGPGQMRRTASVTQISRSRPHAHHGLSAVDLRRRGPVESDADRAAGGGG